MRAACIMGLRYYAIIFSVAFVMGVVRNLVIAPRLGATVAVLIEVSILLTVSWAVAGRLLSHRSFTVAHRAVMGAIAFTLTMVSEVILAEFLRGQSVTDWATNVVTPLGLTGLAGQIAFAVVPLLAVRHRKSPGLGT